MPIEPQNQAQANNTDTQNTDEPKEEESEAVANETIEEDTVEETKDAVKITMKYSTMLNKDKLAIVTDTNRNLELVMADNVKWNIDLSGVDDVHSINVDMAVAMNQADIPKEVMNTLPQENPIILMSLAHEGPFTFEAKLSVPVNKLNVGKIANLFYYNPTTNEMEFIAASQVAEDGTAEFLMAHASDYAIVVADNSLDPNPPEEVAEVTEEVQSEESSETMATGLLIMVIVVVVVLAVIGIIFAVRFFKKKSEDSYYFDEEDEEMQE